MKRETYHDRQLAAERLMLRRRLEKHRVRQKRKSYAAQCPDCEGLIAATKCDSPDAEQHATRWRDEDLHVSRVTVIAVREMRWCQCDHKQKYLFFQPASDDTDR